MAAYPAAAAQSARHEGTKDALLSALNARLTGGFAVCLDAEGTRVRSLAAGRSRPYGSDPISASRAFLLDAAPFLGPGANPDSLAVVGASPTAFGQRVQYRQVLNGVPILGREVSVNLSTAGEVLAVENTTDVLPKVDTAPSISALAVAAMAQGSIVKAPELAVDPDAAAPRLVWRIVSTTAPDRVIRLTVDAHTGEVIARQNLVQFYNTGTGKVYPESPVSTPNLTSVSLPWLSGSTLTGAYAKIYKGAPPGTQDVLEPSLTFNYAAGNTKLAEVEAYWGITAIHDYFKGNLGFTGRDTPAMPAYVHIDGLDNAYFSPYIGTAGGMEFGYNSVGIEYALDTDVLYHEYTHSVVDVVAAAFAASYDDYHEQGGINEGTADYFACTRNGNAVLGEYSLGTDYGRDLRNRNHFPEDLELGGYSTSSQRYYQTLPEVHRTGETWGPACWDLRNALGAATADAIIYKAMTMFTATTGLQQALGYLVTADQQAPLNGAHVATIRQVFNRRGIYETTYPISYLLPDSFYLNAGTSKVYTGYLFLNTNGVFPDYDYNYWLGLGMFPSISTDRWYVLPGYTTDATIQSVFVVLKDAAGAVLGYSGGPTYPLTAKTSSGTTKAYREIQSWYKFPASIIPAGQTTLSCRLYINSYTQSYTTVGAAFSTTTPKSSAPAAGYKAEVLKMRPEVLGGSGSLRIRDAVMTLRYVSGVDGLSGWEAGKADVAAPFTGTPDMADARQMLKIAAGLA